MLQTKSIRSKILDYHFLPDPLILIEMLYSLHKALIGIHQEFIVDCTARKNAGQDQRELIKG